MKGFVKMYAHGDHKIADFNLHQDKVVAEIHKINTGHRLNWRARVGPQLLFSPYTLQTLCYDFL